MDGDQPAVYAAEVAVEIDRVFVAGLAHGGRDRVRGHGGPPAVGTLIEFRTSLAWPDRVVTWPQFAAVTRYRDRAEVRDLVTSNARHGNLAVDDAGFRATANGLAFLAGLSKRQVEAATNMRAASPFETLTVDGHSALLTGLRGLD